MMVYGLLGFLVGDKDFISVVKSFLFRGFHLYYLIVLLMMITLTPILVDFILKSKNKIKLFFPLLITPFFNVLLTILCVKYNKLIPLYNYHIFGWFSYYYFGLLIRYEKISLQFLNRINKLCLYLFALIISLVEGFILYFVFYKYDLSISQITISNFIYSMVVIAVIVLKNNMNTPKTVCKIGDYSYGIYLNHVLILTIVNNVINQLQLQYFLDILLKYSLTLIFVFFINYIYYEKLRKVKYGRNN